jgi:hypothetical protein
MDKLFVLVCQGILEVPLLVDQSAQQTAIVHLMKPVVTKNVEIPVLEPVELMLNAKL